MEWINESQLHVFHRVFHPINQNAVGTKKCQICSIFSELIQHNIIKTNILIKISKVNKKEEIEMVSLFLNIDTKQVLKKFETNFVFFSRQNERIRCYSFNNVSCGIIYWKKLNLE